MGMKIFGILIINICVMHTLAKQPSNIEHYLASNLLDYLRPPEINSRPF